MDDYQTTYSPRYLPGSPGDVELNRIDKEAEMRDERESFKHHLTGLYGEAAKAEALKIGVKGIMVAVWWEGDVKCFRDLMTGEKWKDPQPGRSRAKPKKKDLSKAARKVIAAWKMFDRGVMAGTPMERANLGTSIDELSEILGS